MNIKYTILSTLSVLIIGFLLNQIYFKELLEKKQHQHQQQNKINQVDLQFKLNKSNFLEVLPQYNVSVVYISSTTFPGSYDRNYPLNFTDLENRLIEHGLNGSVTVSKIVCEYGDDRYYPCKDTYHDYYLYIYNYNKKTDDIYQLIVKYKLERYLDLEDSIYFFDRLNISRKAISISDTDNILNHIYFELYNSITILNNEEELNKFKDIFPNGVIIGRFQNRYHPDYQLFEKITQQFKETTKFGVLFDNNNSNDVNSISDDSKSQLPSQVYATWKSNDNQQQTYDVQYREEDSSFNERNLYEFIKKYSIAPMTVFDSFGITHELLGLQNGTNRLSIPTVLFYYSKYSGNQQQYRYMKNQLLNLSLDLRGEVQFIDLVASNNEFFSNPLINLEEDQIFTNFAIFVDTNESVNRYLYNFTSTTTNESSSELSSDIETINIEDFQEWIKKCQNGSVEPYYNSRRYLHQCDNDNLDEIIRSYDVTFVLFCDGWDCETFLPIMSRLATEFKDNKKIALASVDLEVSKEDFFTRFSMNGIPTLLLFNRGNIERYDGYRSFEAIYTYISKNYDPYIHNIEQFETVLNCLDTIIVAVPGNEENDKVSISNTTNDQQSNQHQSKLFNLLNRYQRYPIYYIDSTSKLEFNQKYNLSSSSNAKLIALVNQGKRVAELNLNNELEDSEREDVDTETRSFIDTDIRTFIELYGSKPVSSLNEFNNQTCSSTPCIIYISSNDQIIDMIEEIAKEKKGEIIFCYKYSYHTENEENLMALFLRENVENIKVDLPQLLFIKNNKIVDRYQLDIKKNDIADVIGSEESQSILNWINQKSQ